MRGSGATVVARKRAPDAAADLSPRPVARYAERRASGTIEDKIEIKIKDLSGCGAQLGLAVR